MARALGTAALVIAGAALVATGVGAIAMPAFAGVVSVAGVSTTAMFAAAAGLEAASALLAKKPSTPANPMEWKADPQAGIPYPIGEGYVGGQIIYRMAYGDKNKWQTLVTVHGGGGPHEGFQHCYVDNIIRAVGTSGEVDIPDQGYMYAATQLGQRPETSNLNVGPVSPYGWTADCKLSGYAASIVTVKYDTKGSHTMTSTPQVGWYGRWAKAYDPRKDDTYPGGSGAHRSDDESTWEWTANPILHALTWLIGRRAPNGTLLVGAGISDLSNIIVAQFVEGANINDANGWTVFGVPMSTDDKWDVYKKMLQAGGAVPMRLGGQIGLIINTPRVSLATIGINDVIGEVSVQATNSRKDRINAIVPRYMGKQSVTTQDSDGNLVTSDTYAIQPAAPIVVADYVAFDGGKTRQREVEYSYVQCFDADLKQVAQLARYDLENAREFGPITLPLRLRWMGYRPGDVVTVTIGEVDLQAQDVLLLNRELDPQTGSVTMTARSETAAKHGYALGQTATPAETPGVAIPDLGVAAPAAGDWLLSGVTVSSASGSLPALELKLRAQTADEIADGDSVVDDSVSMIIISYRTAAVGDTPAGDWKSGGVYPPTMTATDLSQGIAPDTSYEVGVVYASAAGTSDMLVVGPETAGDLSYGSALQQAVYNSFIVEVQNGTAVVHIASDGTLTIDDHTRRYQDGHADVSVTGATVATGLAAGDTRFIAYDDPDRTGGAVTYNLYEASADSWASAANPGRHNVGSFTVPSSGSSGGTGGGVGGGNGSTRTAIP